jgi:hypothetical protein
MKPRDRRKKIIYGSIESRNVFWIEAQEAFGWLKAFSGARDSGLGCFERFFDELYKLIKQGEVRENEKDF